jgi:hypothetical protein
MSKINLKIKNNNQNHHSKLKITVKIGIQNHKTIKN